MAVSETYRIANTTSTIERALSPQSRSALYPHSEGWTESDTPQGTIDWY